jgi:hypothetical protein
MATPRPANRGDFLDQAFVSAMRFRWQYRGHESMEKAIASLRRRCPGFTMVQYTNAFQRSTDLYNRALDAVRANEEIIPGLVRVRWTVDDIPGELTEQLRRRVRGFKIATYRQAIGWVIYWHYLR